MKSFKDWLDENEMAQVAAAPLLGVAQSTLSRVLTGEQDASPEFIRRAFRMTNGEIQPNNFFPELFAESAMPVR